VQHEVVGPAGDRERIELDRPQPTEDLEYRFQPALERARRREPVARHEETTCGLCTDLHTEDAIARVD
jgi:hypothetical protein